MSRGCMTLAGIALLDLVVAGCNQPSRSGGLPFQEQIAQAQKETDLELRAKRLIRIGYQQGKAQDVAGAEETLQLAWKDCEAIANPAAQASAWALMTEAQAGLGNRLTAKRAVDSAAAAAAQVKEAENKVRALARVAQAQGAAGEPAAAEATLLSAEKLAAKVDDALGRVLAFSPWPAAIKDSVRQISAIACSGPRWSLPSRSPTQRRAAQPLPKWLPSRPNWTKRTRPQKPLIWPWNRPARSTSFSSGRMP